MKKCASVTIEYEAKEQKVGFISMIIVGALGASLTGNMLASEWARGQGVTWADEGTINN